MKPLLRMIALLYLLLVIVQPAFTQDLSDPTRYYNESYGFHAIAPEGWHRTGKEDESGGGTVIHVMFQSPVYNDGYQRAMWVASQRESYLSAIALKKRFEEDIETFRSEMTKEIRAAGLTGVTVIPISGTVDIAKDAFNIVCEVETEFVDMKFIQHLRYANGRRYATIFLTFAEDYDAEIDEYMECLKGFSIDSKGFDFSRMSNLAKVLLALLLFGGVALLRMILHQGDARVVSASEGPSAIETLETMQNSESSNHSEDHSYSGNYKAKNAAPPTIPTLGQTEDDKPKDNLF